MAQSVKKHPHTASAFAWLEVLNTNVWIILILMVCVAGFTMISGLLILILERTATIGILKAMGMAVVTVLCMALAAFVLCSVVLLSQQFIVFIVGIFNELRLR